MARPLMPERHQRSHMENIQGRAPNAVNFVKLKRKLNLGRELTRVKEPREHVSLFGCFRIETFLV